MFPHHFEWCRVLELGSLIINGSPRMCFNGCTYIGLDWRPGFGVDVVAKAHEYDTGEQFDTIITTEMLEHDLHAEASFNNAMRLLRSGGLFLGTAAGPKREPHEVDCGENNHYQNMSAALIAEWAEKHSPQKMWSSDERNDLDTYFWIIK